MLFPTLVTVHIHIQHRGMSDFAALVDYAHSYGIAFLERVILV